MLLLASANSSKLFLRWSHSGLVCWNFCPKKTGNDQSLPSSESVGRAPRYFCCTSHSHASILHSGHFDPLSFSYFHRVSVRANLWLLWHRSLRRWSPLDWRCGRIGVHWVATCESSRFFLPYLSLQVWLRWGSGLPHHKRENSQPYDNIALEDQCLVPDRIHSPRKMSQRKWSLEADQNSLSPLQTWQQSDGRRSFEKARVGPDSISTSVIPKQYI